MVISKSSHFIIMGCPMGCLMGCLNDVKKIPLHRGLMYQNNMNTLKNGCLSTL